MDLIPLSLLLSGLLAIPAAAGSSPAPALVRLDQVLTQTLQDKLQGRLAPERVVQFEAKFKTDLDAADAEAPRTAVNSDLHARILARLGELDRAEAVASAGSGPRWADSRSGLSRAHFRETTAPAVIATEKAILGSESFNDSRDARGGVSASGGRRIHFASRQAATSLLANLPMPPAPLNNGGPSNPVGAAALAALGSAGAMLLFGGWGGDEVEKRLPGVKNRMGMAAAVGGVLATAGFMLLPAAPLVAQEQPQMASAAEEARPYFLDEGDYVNRVWHSQWESVDGASGPGGSSFCKGSCLPIHAQSAITRRGLNIPGLINDAQHGGLFRVVGRIPAQLRTSIDGVEDEILIAKRYLHLLNYIPESHSQLPPGGPK